MKGRKLTLEEVLNLEDGSVVWVESEEYNNKGQISYLMKDDSWTKEDLYPMFRLSDSYDWNDEYYDGDLFDNLIIYEWIEDSEIVEIKSNVPICCSTCYKMSVEICKLRGLDLTDDNIRLIIEEFS